MSDSVVIAIINVIGLVVVAVVGKIKLDRIGEDAAKARAGATQLHRNGGSTMADGVARIEAKSDRIEAKVDDQGRQLRRVEDDVAQLRREQLADRERFGTLEERVDDGLKEHVTFRRALVVGTGASRAPQAKAAAHHRRWPFGAG